MSRSARRDGGLGGMRAIVATIGVNYAESMSAASRTRGSISQRVLRSGTVERLHARVRAPVRRGRERMRDVMEPLRWIGHTSIAHGSRAPMGRRLGRLGHRQGAELRRATEWRAGRGAGALAALFMLAAEVHADKSQYGTGSCGCKWGL